MDKRSEIGEALQRGRVLAQGLVGTAVDEARELVVREGHKPVVLPSAQEALSSDLSPFRIRLFVDSNDVVVDATAG